MKNKQVKILWLCMVWCLIFCTPGCLAQQAEPDAGKAAAEKTLILYLSRTGNTRAVAEMIHEKTGARLMPIETREPYPQDYRQIVDQVARENETGYLPALNTTLENLDRYEHIFLGFPTWGMQLPPPVKSFLANNDLSGKTIIPFNTNAGYGLGNSIETIRKLCPQSRIEEAFSVKGGIERDGILFVMQGEKEVEVRAALEEWLKKIY